MEPISLIPQTDDWKTIKLIYSLILFGVLVTHFEYFRVFKQTLSELKQTLMPEDFDISVSQVIPMLVLAKNEQKYSDVIIYWILMNSSLKIHPLPVVIL